MRTSVSLSLFDLVSQNFFFSAIQDFTSSKQWRQLISLGSQCFMGKQNSYSGSNHFQFIICTIFCSFCERRSCRSLQFSGNFRVQRLLVLQGGNSIVLHVICLSLFLYFILFLIICDTSGQTVKLSILPDREI